MSTAVLDAHVLLAYLERERGFAVVRDLLTQALKGGMALSMTTANIGEVLYIVRREQDPPRIHRRCGSGPGA